MPAPWDNTPMERRAASGSAIALRPSISASPSSGLSTVYNMRSVVDLPAPFGPSRPVICPSRALKLTPRTATTLPNDLHSPRASNIGTPSRCRTCEGDEERHGRNLQRTTRIEGLRTSRLDEFRHHAIHAGHADLPVAVAGDDHVFAVGEGALGDRRLFGWRHRIIGAGQQQRRHRTLEGCVQILVDHAPGPDAAGRDE